MNALSPIRTTRRPLEIVPMEADDALIIDRQPTQRIQMGIEVEMTPAVGEQLADCGEAWTAWRVEPETGRRPIACMGLTVTYSDALGRAVQGVAWAILGTGIGCDHLAITRHARRRIAASPLKRIEAVVRADIRAECAWARAVGLSPVALLRKFGAASEDHVLFERIR